MTGQCSYEGCGEVGTDGLCQRHAQVWEARAARKECRECEAVSASGYTGSSDRCTCDELGGHMRRTR